MVVRMLYKFLFSSQLLNVHTSMYCLKNDPISVFFQPGYHISEDISLPTGIPDHMFTNTQYFAKLVFHQLTNYIILLPSQSLLIFFIYACFHKNIHRSVDIVFRLCCSHNIFCIIRVKFAYAYITVTF